MAVQCPCVLCALQIPNFCLALPVLLVSAWGIASYLTAWPLHCLWGGFFWLQSTGWLQKHQRGSGSKTGQLTTPHRQATAHSNYSIVGTSNAVSLSGEGSGGKGGSWGSEGRGGGGVCEGGVCEGGGVNAHGLQSTAAPNPAAQVRRPSWLQSCSEAPNQPPALDMQGAGAPILDPLGANSQPAVGAGTLVAGGGSSQQEKAHLPLCGMGALGPQVAVFVYPWTFMAVCALLIMHVEVRQGAQAPHGRQQQ